MPSRTASRPSARSTGFPSALLKGIDRAARHAARQYTALRQRACRPIMRCSGARAAWARVRWSRRCMRRQAAGAQPPLKLIEIHREDIDSCPTCWHSVYATRPASLHRVLRRPLLRGARHVLQIAEGGARRRHRGQARERVFLRDLEPAASDAARDDGERALDRDQSLRGGGGESVALGPFRPLDRLPQLQPGRLSGRWCAAMSRITA